VAAQEMTNTPYALAAALRDAHALIPEVREALERVDRRMHSAVSLIPAPMVRPRYEAIPGSWWGITPERHWMPAENVLLAIVHHAGAAQDMDQSAEAIHHYHTTVKGWGAIGYHFWIRKSGLVQIGRPLWAVGAHAAKTDGTLNLNPVSWGICLAGNFELGHPTDAQMFSLVATLKMLRSIAPPGLAIHGHGDAMVTACPGKHLAAMMGWVRLAVAA
jgi:N-acetyl-anhydromuramyl-L-alanine amidase AmpD